jgi:hypothetical protein
VDGGVREGRAGGRDGGRDGELAFLADAAAGPDDRYPGATDGELDGAIAAWDRVEAHASARKHLAIAEFIRRFLSHSSTPAGTPSAGCPRLAATASAAAIPISAAPVASGPAPSSSRRTSSG